MTVAASRQTNSRGTTVLRAFLVTLPMILLTSFMFIGPRGVPSDRVQLVALTILFVFINGLFFLMVKTGKTDKYRAIFFVVAAICFVITFTSALVAERGSVQLTREDMMNGETPFCHLVIPMAIIPAALTKTIIFPGHLLGGFAPIMGMLVIWLGASLAVGRGWCSWICFFGGLDEGFSRLRRRPIIKKINPKWRYLPHAVLLGGALTSALALSPTYCEWICPFKAVTEFERIQSVKILLQTFMFASLFAGLVVVLPILTKKRIQCGLFCPFASFQSFTNKLNVFDVRIDREKCTDCGQCVNTCPTFSLDEASVERGKTLLSCTKCGHCVDKCPKQAISFHVKGTPVGVADSLPRMLFVYPAYLFGSVMAAGSIIGAVSRVLHLALG